MREQNYEHSISKDKQEKYKIMKAKNKCRHKEKMEKIKNRKKEDGSKSKNT